MKPYETSATVEAQGRLQIVGVPFAAGTQVEVTVKPKAAPDDALAATNDQDLTAARTRMQELFRTIKGFHLTPKISREEVYERRGL